MMTLAEAIGESKGLAMWLHQHIDDIQITTNGKERAGLTLMQHALDLDDAIIVLLERNLPGPSLALARPRFEAYVRGLWLIYAATDEDFSRFIESKYPNFPSLLKAIESSKNSGSAWVKANADLNLKDFHDLTHGGATHLERRTNNNAIEPCYPENELVSLLLFGTEIRMRVGVEFLLKLDNHEVILELQERANKLRSQP